MLGYFYLRVFTRLAPVLSTWACHFSMVNRRDGRNFPSLPLGRGYLTRTLSEHFRGREWYETKLLPRLRAFRPLRNFSTPSSSSRPAGSHHYRSGRATSRECLATAVLFSAIMWFGLICFRPGDDLPTTEPDTRLTAACNNFELAISVCIGFLA